jgi:uncharacterized oxidoreductase
MPRLTAAVLTDFAARLFEKVGVSPADALTVARSLVGANLRGHDSHGVMRVPQYVGFLEAGYYRPGVELKVEAETPALAVCDGQSGLGQVQAYRLLDLLLPKARAVGISAGTIRQCGHIGRLGEYAERAAAEGCVLIATVNNNGSAPRVAPPGGLEPRISTNPLCAAVPTADPGAPVVLDFGTSAAAEGKVRVHHINRTPVPEGWLLDHQGRPTTDPDVLYHPPLGSILPMGGAQAYKGFGLGLVLDMLTAGLSGGRTCFAGAPPARENSVVFIAIDPARFSGRDHLIGEATCLADAVRSTPRAEGVEAILLPGDPERRTLDERSARGIPLDPNHWTKLLELAERLRVTPPEPAGD